MAFAFPFPLPLYATLGPRPSAPLALLTQATVLLYGCNTLLVAAVLWLTEDKPLSGMWWQCHFWSFPYYAVGAAAAYLVIVTSNLAGWQSPLLALALMTLVFVSYRLHVRSAESAAQAREAVVT